MTPFLPCDFFENDEYEYTDFECIVELTFKMTEIDFWFYWIEDDDVFLGGDIDELYEEVGKDIKSKTFTTKLKIDDYDYLKDILDNHNGWDIDDLAYDIIVDYIQDEYGYMGDTDYYKKNRYYDIFDNTFELEVTKLEVKEFHQVKELNPLVSV